MKNDKPLAPMRAVDARAWTLTEYGMRAEEEDDLRFFFAHDSEPSDPRVRERWLRVCSWLPAEGNLSIEVETELEPFFRDGLLPYAAKSKAAEDAYERAHEMPPRPNGGAAMLEWDESARRQPPFMPWLRGICQRRANGTATAPERLLLDQIEREIAPKLQDLVVRLSRHRAFFTR
jgi:hypothetical protein